jgi:lipoprotein-releasing system ATP-binding protein
LSNPAPILSATGLHKSFKMGESVVTVLRDCDFDLADGEFVAIEGRSGSGKSTLLHLLGALDRPAKGTIAYRGNDLSSAPDGHRALLRNREFGFVFQFYHLLPELNVLENTSLAAMVRDSTGTYLRHKSEIRARATDLLKQLGLDHRLRHRPNQLSGGERQRVAIARALMNSPKVIFADEPTGNLDADTGRQIMDLLESLHTTQGQSIVMVTHDRTLAKEADRTLILREGRLVPA